LHLYEIWSTLHIVRRGKSSDLQTSTTTYKGAKDKSRAYQEAKTTLRSQDNAPFASWIINDEKYQRFALELV